MPGNYQCVFTMGVFVLGCLLTLPGCGGSGNSASLTRQSAVETQTFAGNATAPAAYALDYPIDTTRPFKVTINGIPQVLGVDFTIDATALNIVHLTKPTPQGATVTIQYSPHIYEGSRGHRFRFR